MDNYVVTGLFSTPCGALVTPQDAAHSELSPPLVDQGLADYHRHIDSSGGVPDLGHER